LENYSEIPSSFVVGDTLIIEISDPIYPAPGNSLSLVLLSPTGKGSFSSVASGANHLLTIDTSTLAAGRWDYQLKVIGTGFQYTKQVGHITGQANFADLTTHDGRSHVKKVLDALEAAIEGRASNTQLKRDIDGVAIEYMSHEQLLSMRDKYRLKYLKEQASAQGSSPFRTITPRFDS